MPSEWFLKSGDQIKGPIPIEKIAGAIAAGKIPGADIVVSPSSDGPWQPIHSVPEFAELLVPSAGQGTPPQGMASTDDPQRPVPVDPSLGEQHTYEGGGQPADASDRSLGDQSTFAGDDGSSISDLGSLTGDADLDMEIVDLSRYEVQETLGQGGMGEVLLATDTRLNRKVAI
ncbi:MAG: hypothetical protein ABGZ17_16940, partial [Planctomycetaceae bacterium]